MSEHHSMLSGILMEGLVSFRPAINPVDEPRMFTIMVGQYVEALVSICCTQEALMRAVADIRRTRKDRFWPTIAEVTAAAREALASIEWEGRLRLPAPAPQPPRPPQSPQERALMSAKLTLLARGLANRDIPPLREINEEAARMVERDHARLSA